MITKTVALARGYTPGRHLNLADGVWRVLSQGKKLGCFPGGRGVCEAELVRIADGTMTEVELLKLDQEARTGKVFVAASVSSNTNSFGLWGVIFIALCGEAWEVACNDLSKPRQGDKVTVPLDTAGQPCWTSLGYEVPSKLAPAPPKVVAELWS